MKKENKQYNGWLVSNNFWKRAIAVWAYGLVIPGIIYAVIFAAVIIWTLS